MPTHITDADTKKIAGLIKIHLQDDEVAKYTSQSNTTLDAMEVLKELDTEKVVLA